MNLQYELSHKENFNNVKIGITFFPYSDNVNTYKLGYTINKKYNLVDYGPYFIPYFYGIGPFGGEVLMCETKIKRYREIPKQIKKECLNKFIRGEENHCVQFYGYFENMAKANRVYNLMLKPYLLEKFLPFEGITDNNLIDSIRNLRFK